MFSVICATHSLNTVSSTQDFLHRILLKLVDFWSVSMCVGCSTDVTECLEEVWCGVAWWNDPVWVRHCTEQLGITFRSVVDSQDGGDVATSVAVVGCRPHSHQLLIKHVLISYRYSALPCQFTDNARHSTLHYSIQNYNTINWFQKQTILTYVIFE